MLLDLHPLQADQIAARATRARRRQPQRSSDVLRARSVLRLALKARSSARVIASSSTRIELSGTAYVLMWVGWTLPADPDAMWLLMATMIALEEE